MQGIFIGLGSNMGRRNVHLSTAISLLEGIGIKLISQSSIYQTPPWGNADQPAFLNQVIQVETTLPAADLMLSLLETEAQMGRIRAVKWGPRIIDLDLLEYNGEVIHTPLLTLPHPWLGERAFVLVPWAEIAPDHMPGGHSHSISRMRDALPLHEVAEVRIWEGEE